MARDLGQDFPDHQRTFDYVLTHDRATVLDVARALMSRAVPIEPNPHSSARDPEQRRPRLVAQISDGAAAVVVMSKKKAEELGVEVLATIGSHGWVAGPDNSLSGSGTPRVTDPEPTARSLPPPRAAGAAAVGGSRGGPMLGGAPMV